LDGLSSLATQSRQKLQRQRRTVWKATIGGWWNQRWRPHSIPLRRNPANPDNMTLDVTLILSNSPLQQQCDQLSPAAHSRSRSLAASLLRHTHTPSPARRALAPLPPPLPAPRGPHRSHQSRTPQPRPRPSFPRSTAASSRRLSASTMPVSLVPTGSTAAKSGGARFAVIGRRLDRLR